MVACPALLLSVDLGGKFLEIVAWPMALSQSPGPPLDELQKEVHPSTVSVSWLSAFREEGGTQAGICVMKSFQGYLCGATLRLALETLPIHVSTPCGHSPGRFFHQNNSGSLSLRTITPALWPLSRQDLPTSLGPTSLGGSISPSPPASTKSSGFPALLSASHLLESHLEASSTGHRVPQPQGSLSGTTGIKPKHQRGWGSVGQGHRDRARLHTLVSAGYSPS